LGARPSLFWTASSTTTCNWSCLAARLTATTSTCVDYLRLHPQQAAAYGREKQRHEHLLATDREAYVAEKGPFVRTLLAQSRMRA